MNHYPIPVKSEHKEEVTVDTLSSGKLLQRNVEEKETWEQKFHALADHSDSTIQMLKKENQNLKNRVEKIEYQSTTTMETEPPVMPVKAEPTSETEAKLTLFSATGKLLKVQNMS